MTWSEGSDSHDGDDEEGGDGVDDCDDELGDVDEECDHGNDSDSHDEGGGDVGGGGEASWWWRHNWPSWKIYVNGKRDFKESMLYLFVTCRTVQFDIQSVFQDVSQ